MENDGHRLSPRELEDERRLAERAAEWVSILEHAGDIERSEFTEWLTTSPRHMEEFLLATVVSEELRSMPLESFPAVRKRLAEMPLNVVPFPTDQVRAAEEGAALELRQGRSMRANSGFRRNWLAGLAAGIALALLGAAGTWWHVTGSPAVYTTAIGEQRTINLSDGSIVDLNTHSRLEVRFTKDARKIRLLWGEALFTVRHDPRRPFLVATNTALIQDLGTRFDVYQQASGTTVSVVEGHIDVASAAPSSMRQTLVQLGVGDIANIAVTGRVISRSVPDRVARLIAWRQHRLMFLSNTLAHIATEFNRYNREPQIEVLGAAAQRRYSGVFDSNDPQSLIEFLRGDSGIVVKQEGEELVVALR